MARLTSPAAIRKEIVLTQIAGLPGTLCLVLALYGLFIANGNAFHPLLNEPLMLYGLLLAGIVIEACCIIRTISMSRRLRNMNTANH
ncbi:MAG: hypothetical protein CVV07_06290 [Gammaproteobacteria bacterium HGW-Gammaproteobacteria-11]|nr:MAG: hypothetical protein CVV07_06290 [Gammaproteobacteria bacterium HGW-Gammaproteobacteria-11]